MRQTRLSIGCLDWQQTVLALGLDAAALYLYLRTIMRTMQAAEITVTVSEIAEAVKQPAERVETALAAICAAGYFTTKSAHAARAAGQALHVGSSPDVPSVERDADAKRKTEITLLCPDEKRALAEAARKRSARALARSKKVLGQSGYIFFAQSGPSADSPAPHADASEQKEYTSEVAMIYHPKLGEPSHYALSNQYRKRLERKKEPHTPQKEESLTEIQTHTRSNKTCEQPELPADALESEYIDVIGSWPASLRKAVRSEAEDVREAFYLCIRKRQADEGRVWSADQVRMALLAARRIPAERRSDSILAWGMGGWKTIRDCGSGVYFEKETGRVVSLVRDTIEPKGAQVDPANATLAEKLARNMRRA